MSPYILISSLQYTITGGDKLNLHASLNGYPTGGIADIQAPSRTLLISNIRYGSKARYYVELVPEDDHSYTKNILSTNLLVQKGKMCTLGCGVGGQCDIATGKCKCYVEKGFWGESCQIKGCKQGEACTTDTGRGTTVCDGPNRSVCHLTSCKDQIFARLDTTQNQCVESFPTDIFASVVSVSGVVCGLIGIIITSIICSARNKRRHYHYVD
jgi:hypothetical protein